jgi:hypothetical protein
MIRRDICQNLSLTIIIDRRGLSLRRSPRRHLPDHILQLHTFKQQSKFTGEASYPKISSLSTKHVFPTTPLLAKTLRRDYSATFAIPTVALISLLVPSEYLQKPKPNSGPALQHGRLTGFTTRCPILNLYLSIFTTGPPKSEQGFAHKRELPIKPRVIMSSDIKFQALSILSKLSPEDRKDVAKICTKFQQEAQVPSALNKSGNANVPESSVNTSPPASSSTSSAPMDLRN